MKILKSISLLFMICSGMLYGQNDNSYTDQFINDAITEVYQNHADELVFNSSSSRFSLITHFFKNQLSIRYMPNLKDKNFVSTNNLPLNNKYNSSLQRDVIYNANTFNPLKYGIQIAPLSAKQYRIANTDYIIFVTPFKN